MQKTVKTALQGIVLPLLKLTRRQKETGGKESVHHRHCFGKPTFPVQTSLTCPSGTYSQPSAPVQCALSTHCAQVSPAPLDPQHLGESWNLSFFSCCSGATPRTLPPAPTLSGVWFVSYNLHTLGAHGTWRSSDGFVKPPRRLKVLKTKWMATLSLLDISM